MALRPGALLSDEAVFNVLASHRATHAIDEHHSPQLLVEQIVPNIFLETPEIVAEAQKSTQLLTINSIHIARPVAKGRRGAWDTITPAACRFTRNTYAVPVLADVTHRSYSNTETPKIVPWEAQDPNIIAARIAGDPAAIAAAAAAAASAPHPHHGHSAKTGPTPRPPRRKRNITNSRAPPLATTSGPGKPGTASQALVPATAPGGAMEEETLYQKDENHYRHVFLFLLPIQAPGGAHIIKGSDKIVLPQKRLGGNRLYVFASSRPMFTWTAEIRACHSTKVRSTSTDRIHVRCGPEGTGPLRAVVQVPYIEMDIPIMAVVRLMGFPNAEAAATAAATGGALSGRTPIPRGSLWDTHPVHATRQWVLALLRDDAHMYPAFEDMDRAAILQWIGDIGCTRKTPAFRARTVANLMANEFLPQMGLDSAPRTIAGKGAMLAFILWRMSIVARKVQARDSKDHAGNKTFDTPPVLEGQQTRQHVRKWRKRVIVEMRRVCEAGRPIQVPEVMAMKAATDSLQYSLGTGNWGMSKAGSSQSGVSQLYIKPNLVAAMSHKRRLATGMNRDGRAPKPRQTQLSAWGNVCPAETPEGSGCGLVEQMAQTSLFCTGHPTSSLISRACVALGVIDHGSMPQQGGALGLLIPLLDAHSTTGAVAQMTSRVSIREGKAAYVPRVGVVRHADGAWDAVHAAQDASDAIMVRQGPNILRLMVNGVMVGFVYDAHRAARALREARSVGAIPFDVGIEVCVAQGTLTVNGEPGGLRRPLFVLKPDAASNGHLLGAVMRLAAQYAHAEPTELWRALVREGAVEFVSKHEEEGDLLVMLNPCAADSMAAAEATMYTHTEIHPSVILGLAAGAIPFPNHTQAPRLAYYSSMSKQTIGVVPTGAVGSCVLKAWYPQTPLVTTWSAAINGMLDFPAGTNVWVAIACVGGSNQEDSMVVNADGAARGLFGAFVCKTRSEDCTPGTGPDSQMFQKPPKGISGSRVGNPSKLNDDGMPAPGTLLNPGDTIIGSTMLINDMNCPKRTLACRDRSMVLSPADQPCIVDGVVRVTGRDDRELASVHTHTTRLAKEGDKLTSEHGQKGVIGAMWPASHMPYSECGIVTDMVINPHAIPSRMTIGQLIAMGLGHVAASLGVTGDGTAFRDVSVPDLLEAMASAGFQDMGHIQMFDGRTGRPIAHKLFCGPMLYLRVKQMADDKHHARARGPVTNITQQPVEGKAQEGGLRFGEMERDAVQAHGASAFLEDRLNHQSDYGEPPICTTCGGFAMNRAPADKRDLIVGRNENSGYCKVCKAKGNVVNVPMPTGTRVMFHEVSAMHLRPIFTVDVNPMPVLAIPAGIGVKLADNLSEALALAPSYKPRTRTAAPQLQQSKGSTRSLPKGFGDNETETKKSAIKGQGRQVGPRHTRRVSFQQPPKEEAVWMPSSPVCYPNPPASPLYAKNDVDMEKPYMPSSPTYN